MKNNKIKKNILFVFLTIIIISLTCIFNYKMDPYNLFSEKEYFSLQDYPRDLIYTAIKKYKGPKLNTVLIGGSDSITMFNNHCYKDYFNLLCTGVINYDQYKDILDYYIKINPNTKNVIIIAGYSNLINNLYIPLQNLEKNTKLREFQTLYFSIKTTKDSFKILIQNIINLLNYKKESNDNIFIYDYLPNYFDSFDLTKEEIDLLEKKNIERINNLIKFLNNKNINYTLIIPPYNISYLSLIYEKKFYQEKIDNFRRYIVNIVKENTKIYDFAFVNKYTTSDISENKDALYYNNSHPSIIWGAKIHKILYNKTDKYENLYFLLNKTNVESIIRKEHLLLNEYIKNNSNKIEYFKKLYNNENKEIFSETKKISEYEMTEETRNEFKYLQGLYNIEDI